MIPSTGASDTWPSPASSAATTTPQGSSSTGTTPTPPPGRPDTTPTPSGVAEAQPAPSAGTGAAPSASADPDVSTIHMGVAFPVSSFDTGVEGVPVLTNFGVPVPADKADAVRAAAHAAQVTIEEN